MFYPAVAYKLLEVPIFRPAHVVTIILALLFVVSPCYADRESSHDDRHPADHRNFRSEQSLQHLLSALITRPEVTSDTDRRALLPALHAGAQAFVAAFNHDKRLHHFSRGLRPLLAAYDAEISSAAAGLAGAEARGAALDRLLSGVLDAAKLAKIDLEDVDIAFLQAAAAIENGTKRPPAAKVLCPEDRELVFLLLQNCTNQVHKRIVLLAEPHAALTTLGTDPALVAAYSQRFMWSATALSRELVGLEEILSDPTSLGDLSYLMVMQFNEEARTDMLFMKVAMEAYFFSFQHDLSAQLAATMASMGGMMANMTATKLQEAGLLSASPNSYLFMAAYTWIGPAKTLVYTPDSTLADKLVQIGATVPQPPDFSIVSSPYRDIFQLRYDISMLDQWWSKEQTIASAQETLDMHPLSMSARLALRIADASRRQAVMARVHGVASRELHALRILLSPAF